MVSRHPDHWSTFPLPNLRFIALAWIVTAIVLGVVAARFQTIRSWGMLAISTVIGWFGAMGLMLALAPAEPKPAESPKFATTAELMSYCATEAARWTKEQKGIELDYSMDSIQIIEEELDNLSKQVNKANPQKGTFGQAMGYGAYIGEVVRKHYGGTWAVALRANPPASSVR